MVSHTENWHKFEYQSPKEEGRKWVFYSNRVDKILSTQELDSWWDAAFRRTGTGVDKLPDAIFGNNGLLILTEGVSSCHAIRVTPMEATLGCFSTLEYIKHLGFTDNECLDGRKLPGKVCSKVKVPAARQWKKSTMDIRVQHDIQLIRAHMNWTLLSLYIGTFLLKCAPNDHMKTSILYPHTGDMVKNLDDSTTTASSSDDDETSLSDCNASQIYSNEERWLPTTKQTVEDSEDIMAHSLLNWDLLKDTSVPILHYSHIPLYSDDLADCGEAESEVKLRVMDTCWFALLTHTSRVDHTVQKSVSVRLFHEFGTDTVIREVTISSKAHCVPPVVGGVPISGDAVTRRSGVTSDGGPIVTITHVFTITKN